MTTTTDQPENPPAFPVEAHRADTLDSPNPGMTLRDYFAATLSFDPDSFGVAQAEALMGEKQPGFTVENAGERLAWWLAAEAKYRYTRADAMLRERGK